MIPTTSLALEIALRATLILTAVLLATWVLRRAAPVLTATVQNFALPGLLLLPVLNLFGPTLPWRVLPVRGEERQQEPRRSLQVAGVPPRPRESTGAAIDPAAAVSIAVSAPNRRMSATPAARGFRVPPITGASMVAALYAAVCLMLLARIVFGFRRLRGLIAAASPVERGDWVDELERWRTVLNLRRVVRLVASGTVNTPLTLPCRRPIIVIPAELEQTATAEQRRAAILHELIHVRRSDPAWNVRLRIVEAMYWFHPLMWLVSRSIVATRELVCDSVCARHLGTESYTGALIQLAGRLKRSSLPAVGLAMARTSRLGRRLHALRQAGTSERTLPRPAQAAAMALLVALLVFVSSSIRPVAAVAPPQAPSAVTLSGRLIDERGEPFREIELEVRITSSTPGPEPDYKTSKHRIKTDREGRFSFQFVPEPRPERTFQLKFHGDWLMPYAAWGLSQADLRNGTLGDIPTQRRFLKQGRVLDPTGRPVAGARVLAVPKRDLERKQSSPIQSEDFRKLFAKDPDAFRKEAERLLDEIITNSPRVRAPDREWAGPRWIRLVDVTQDHAGNGWSIAEQAGFLHFQITRLRIGQLAPILEGTDLINRPIRLSDFAGKVVALTLTTFPKVDDRDMYDRCKRLLDEFKGRPVVCLSVVPTGEGSASIQDIVRAMGITWPVIRDASALMYRWCLADQTVYVIDQRGLLCYIDPGKDLINGSLFEKVRALLKAQQP